MSGCGRDITQGGAAFSTKVLSRFIRGMALWTPGSESCAALRTELTALSIFAAALGTAHTSPPGPMISPGKTEAFLKPPSLGADGLSTCDR
jgi:hypothetical protein